MTNEESEAFFDTEGDLMRHQGGLVNSSTEFALPLFIAVGALICKAFPLVVDGIVELASNLIPTL